jgi:hypothetical protein
VVRPRNGPEALHRLSGRAQSEAGSCSGHRWAILAARRTIATMTRPADPDHPGQARRDTIRDALLHGGMDSDVADRWCDAWETEAVLEGVEQGPGYWDAGKRWIDVQCAARKRPPD